MTEGETTAETGLFPATLASDRRPPLRGVGRAGRAPHRHLPSGQRPDGGHGQPPVGRSGSHSEAHRKPPGGGLEGICHARRRAAGQACAHLPCRRAWPAGAEPRCSATGSCTPGPGRRHVHAGGRGHGALPVKLRPGSSPASRVGRTNRAAGPQRAGGHSARGAARRGAVVAVWEPTGLVPGRQRA